jgi:hypothetical protein
MKALVILFVLAACTFCSCSFIAKKGYGAKRPGVENQQSIENWLRKHIIDKEHVVTVRPENFFDLSGYQATPFLFDRHSGRFVAVGYTDGAYCPKGVDQVLETISPYKLLRPKPDSFITYQVLLAPDSRNIKEARKAIKKEDGPVMSRDTVSFDLFEFFRQFSRLDGSAASLESTKEADYVLILPFALYLGNRLQVQDLKKYYRAARRNMRSEIKVIFLNLDKQEWWGPEWNRKIDISI